MRILRCETFNLVFSLVSPGGFLQNRQGNVSRRILVARRHPFLFSPAYVYLTRNALREISSKETWSFCNFQHIALGMFIFLCRDTAVDIMLYYISLSTLKSWYKLLHRARTSSCRAEIFLISVAKDDSSNEILHNNRRHIIPRDPRLRTFRHTSSHYLSHAQENALRK